MRKEHKPDGELISEIYASIEANLEIVKGKCSKWFKSYWHSNKLRYLSDLSFVKKYHHEGPILEIGGAPFHFTYILQKHGFKVTSLDIEPMRFQPFVEKFNLNTVKCNVEIDNLPTAENTAETVIFFEIFEHLRINPIETLAKITKCIKPGGLIMLQTPNLYYSRRLYNFMLGKGFDNPYNEWFKLEKLGHMGHTRVYTSGQIKQFLSKTGTIPIARYFVMKENGAIRKRRISYLVAKIFPRLRTHILVVAKKPLD